MILKDEQAKEWLRLNSRHFSAGELACKCGCGALVIDVNLITKLERVRNELGRPLTVTSCTRCAAHNVAEGGKTGSEHLTGQAVDIAVANSTERFELIESALSCGFSRLGIAKGFVHLGNGTNQPANVAWLY